MPPSPPPAACGLRPHAGKRLLDVSANLKTYTVEIGLLACNDRVDVTLSAGSRLRLDAHLDELRLNVEEGLLELVRDFLVALGELLQGFVGCRLSPLALRDLGVELLNGGHQFCSDRVEPARVGLKLARDLIHLQAQWPDRVEQRAPFEIHELRLPGIDLRGDLNRDRSGCFIGECTGAVDVDSALERHRACRLVN